MKLKYYLRTLGIGIFVTALILTVSSKLHGVSDEEVIQRAKELGMTEAKNQVLSDLREQQNTEPSKEPGKTVPSVSEQEESGNGGEHQCLRTGGGKPEGDTAGKYGGRERGNNGDGRGC